jgi:metal-responsive CopG/Arc/MetJ family transcriptional regulator
MKKTPLTHSSEPAPSCSNISVISESKEQITKLELDIPKELYDGLVEIGKEYASDSDYIEIAVRACLEEYTDKS